MNITQSEDSTLADMERTHRLLARALSKLKDSEQHTQAAKFIKRLRMKYRPVSRYTARDFKEQSDLLAARMQELQGAFLQGRGWKYTSQTAGCVWMWSKNHHKAGKIWTSAEKALAIEIGEDGVYE